MKKCQIEEKTSYSLKKNTNYFKEKKMVPGQNGTSYNLSDRMSLRGAGLWNKTLSKTWRREVRPREGGQERQRNKGNTLKRDWKYNVTAENIEIFEMHNAREKSPIRINHQKDQRMPVLKHLSCLHANHSG